MFSSDDNQQGRRLLIAMITLIIVVPVLAAILIVPSVLFLEYAWGGGEAVTRAITRWSEPSPHVQDVKFRLSLALVGCFAIGVPVIIWYRLFVTTGYLSKQTLNGIDRGQLPVIGGYWKPVMYLGYIAGGLFGAYISFQQGAYIVAVLFAGGGVWFSYKSIRELKKWCFRNKRHTSV